MPLGQITEEHYDRTFDINVKGTVFTVQKALPLMGSGSTIVLNASIAGIKGMPAFSIYSATKAAMRNLARGWAVDLKGRGIRINVISPGVVPTEAYPSFGDAAQVDAFVAGMVGGIPLGRPGTPDEVAKAVVFLACDDSSYVHGTELFVDGGMAQI